MPYTAKRIYLSAILAAAVVAAPATSSASLDPCDHELDGPVQSIDTANRTVRIAGVDVQIPENAEIELENGRRGGFEDITVGRVIEVEGQPTETGWTACEVDIQRKPTPVVGKKARHAVKSTIDEIDAEARTLTVGGVLVQVHNSTKLEDDDDRRILFEDFRVGQVVEAEGSFQEDGVLKARKVEIDD